MDELIARAATTILAPPEDVFDAIVTGAVVTTFFPDRSTGDLVEGAEVQWEFDHADAVVNLHVTEVTRPHTIRFDWNAAQHGFKPVNFTLHSVDGATSIEVIESGYELTPRLGAAAIRQTNGWAEFLGYLKARIQFGIELRIGREKN